MKTITRLWIGIAVLIALSPLGILLPAHFKSGDAWGEWGSDGVKELVGYIPQGLGKISLLWSAPIADYAFKGWEEKGLASLSFAYIISALIGILAVVLTALAIGAILTKKSDK